MIENKDEFLYQELQTLRKQIATERTVPLDLVFSDSSIQHMARLRPSTRDEFFNIPGVNLKRCQLYADIFIEVIRRVISEQFIETVAHEEPSVLQQETKEFQQIYTLLSERHSHLLNESGLPNSGISISNGKQTRRYTHCYKCKKDLDNTIYYECNICKWILCSCGACGCGWKGRMDNVF